MVILVSSATKVLDFMVLGSQGLRDAMAEHSLYSASVLLIRSRWDCGIPATVEAGSSEIFISSSSAVHLSVRTWVLVDDGDRIRGKAEESVILLIDRFSVLFKEGNIRITVHDSAELYQLLWY